MTDVDLQERVNLQPYNTLAVPAQARYYAQVADPDQLPKLIQFARGHNLPLLVLGGGSNLVLREHYPGLVLHVKLQGREKVGEDQEHVWLKVAAGENWHQLVQYGLEKQYWGLENLALIPGSVGAAPIQNIGAYGVELKDHFKELQAINLETGQLRSFDKEACEFGYRDSIFKRDLLDQYLILSVTLQLNKRAQLNASYPSLRTELASIPPNQLTPKDLYEAVCRVRASKLPDPAQVPNVGSFFKNPVIDVSRFQELQAAHPGLVSYSVNSRQVKLAAGWLIERAGWKGIKRGPVAVHSEQALVLTNPGQAMGEAVLTLAEEIRASVAAEYGIDLEPEPRVYP